MDLKRIKKDWNLDDLGYLFLLREINEEILKGEKITLISNEKENKQDKYFFETGYFNLNKNEFLGKNINIIFHKKLFDN